MKSILFNFINGALSGYISGITKDSVNMKFFQNQLSLTDLHLKKYAFFQHGLPVKVKSSVIQSVDIKIPWSSFQNDPVNIFVKNCVMVLKLPCNDFDEFVNEKEFFDIRESQLDAHELFKKRYFNLLKTISKQTLENIVARCLYSLQMNISNLHVIVEFPDDDKSDIIGFEIQNIKLSNPKVEEGIPKYYEKEIMIKGISFYLDNAVDCFKEENDIMEYVESLSKLKHDYVYQNEMISGNIQIKENESGFNTSVQMESMCLNINQTQLKIIFKIIYQMKKFANYLYFKRNVSYDWMCLHEFALKKENKLLDKFILNLLNLKKYTKLWKEYLKTKIRNQDIIELDHKLDYQTIIYYRFLAEHSSTNKVNYDELLDWIKIDPFIIVSNIFKNNFHFQINIDFFKIIYKTNDLKLALIMVVMNPFIITTKDIIEFGFNSFNLHAKENNESYTICKTLSEELDSFNGCFNIDSKSLSILCKPTSYFVNVIQLINIITMIDFKLLSSCIPSKSNNSKAITKSNVLFNSITFIFGLDKKSAKMISFGCDKFELNQISSKINANINGLRLVFDSFNNHTIIENTIINISVENDNTTIFMNQLKIDLLKDEIQFAFDYIIDFLKSNNYNFKIYKGYIYKNVKFSLDDFQIKTNMIERTMKISKFSVSNIYNCEKQQMSFYLEKFFIDSLVDINNFSYNFDIVDNNYNQSLLIKEILVYIDKSTKSVIKNLPKININDILYILFKYDIILKTEIPLIEVIMCSKYGVPELSFPISKLYFFIDKNINDQKQSELGLNFGFKYYITPQYFIPIIETTTLTSQIIISPKIFELNATFSQPVPLIITQELIKKEKLKTIKSNVFWFVNEINIPLTIIIDSKQIFVPPSSSSFIKNFPSKSIISLSLFDKIIDIELNKFRDEYPVPIKYNDSYIIVQLKPDSLIFSSLLNFNNQTSTVFKIFNDVTILPGDSYMFPPDRSLTQTITIQIENEEKELELEIQKNITIPIIIGNHNFIFCFYRDILTLIGTITISTPIIIQSFFPKPLQIEFPNHEIINICLSEPQFIDYFNSKTSKISLEISNDEYINKSKVNISISKSSYSTLTLYNCKNSECYLRCEVIKENMVSRILLSSPILIYNQITIPFGLLLEKDCSNLPKEKNEDLNLFKPLKEYSKEPPPPFPYMGIKEEDFSIYVSCPVSRKISDSKCGISRVDSKELILIPISESTDKVIPVSFIVKHKSKLFPNTIHLYFIPYFILHNETDYDIDIGENVLHPEYFVAIKSVLPSLDLEIKIQKHVIQINLEKVTTFFLLHPKTLQLYKFEVEYKNNCKLLSIKKLENKKTLGFINETSNTYKFFQKGHSNLVYKVLPNSTFLFNLADSRDECEIEIEQNENTNKLSLHVDTIQDLTYSDSLKIFYSVEYIWSLDKFIIHILENKQVDTNITFKLKVIIPSLSIKLFTQNNVELIRITLDQIEFGFRTNKSKKLLEFAIHSIQIDDMNSTAIYPIILQSLGSEGNSFINIIFQAYDKFSNIELFVCNFSYIKLFIDLSLIGDIAAMFKELEFNSFESASTIKVNILKIFHKNIEISFNPNTSREGIMNFTFPHFVYLIPPLENINLSIKTLESQQLKCTTKQMLNIIEDYYMRSIGYQWLRIIGSTAIIGNPQKLINNFTNSFHQTNIISIPKEIVGGTVDSLLTSSVSTINMISNLLKSISSSKTQIQDNQTAKGAFQWGFKSLVSGITNAATGVVTNPIKKGKEEGLIGVVKGTGQGLIGVFTNSIGGALDFGAGMINGIRRGVFGSNQMKRVEEPIPFEGNTKELIYCFNINDNILEIYPTKLFFKNQIILIQDIGSISLDDSTKILHIYSNEESKEIAQIQFTNYSDALRSTNIINIQNLKYKLHFEKS